MLKTSVDCFSSDCNFWSVSIVRKEIRRLGGKKAQAGVTSLHEDDLVALSPLQARPGTGQRGHLRPIKCSNGAAKYYYRSLQWLYVLFIEQLLYTSRRAGPFA